MTEEKCPQCSLLGGAHKMDCSEPYKKKKATCSDCKKEIPWHNVGCPQMTTPASDSPSHYGGNWEIADFIKAQGLDFILGNVLKYVCRAAHKGTELQDLRKAIHYIEKRIKDLQPATDK